jgi:hypothetical protein
MTSHPLLVGLLFSLTSYADNRQSQLYKSKVIRRILIRNQYNNPIETEKVS